MLACRSVGSRLIAVSMNIRVLISLGVLGGGSVLSGATNFISDQLPSGKTLADYGLGVSPVGGSESAVRLVELATLPNAEQVQQIVSHGDKLYLATIQGRVWVYDLVDGLEAEPFLDLVGLSSHIFRNAGGWFASRGLRGFAIHPDFENNGLVYTMQKVLPDGSAADYGKADPYAEYLCVEWDFNTIVDEMPTMRQLFRVRFEHDYHVAQHLVFNPTAAPGDPDYGLLYAGLGDNGIRTGGVIYESQIRELNDVSNVAQDFNSVQGGGGGSDPSAGSVWQNGWGTGIGGIEALAQWKLFDST